MRKALTLTTMLALGTASLPAAAADYGMAGCGLGSLIIKNNDITQIFATTTNGTFANQSLLILLSVFGIEAAGCVNDGLVRADREQEAFAEVNHYDLKQDMASGNGEYLGAFVTLLGCEEEARPAVYEFAQQTYATTYPSDETTPAQALYGFKLQVSQQPELTQACTRI